MAAGIIVQTAAHSMTAMIWGRLVAGVGNGGNTATAPVWHVETSHHDAKGSAVVKEMAVNVLVSSLLNHLPQHAIQATFGLQSREPSALFCMPRHLQSQR